MSTAGSLEGRILRSFDLSAIGMYFPDYERDIRQRLTDSPDP